MADTPLTVLDSTGATVYEKEKGAGSSGDPHRRYMYIGDGDSETLGSKTDNRSTATDTTSVSIEALIKQMSYMLQNPAVVPLTTFSVSDSITRPANATPYAATKAVNCNVSVTGVSIASPTVTLTAANAFAVGDRITVAGVNSGWGVTGVDGNWTCIAGTNATTVVYTAVTPAGTPSGSGGTIAKMMSVDVAGVAGGGIILSELKLELPGKAMTGAMRLYIDNAQTTVLVDQAAYTTLNANASKRVDYYDFLTPATEDSTSSDQCVATWRGWQVIKCAAADTRLYFRLVAEGAGTPTSAGVVSVTASGIRCGG